MAVCNGSAALDLAVEALDIRAGDEIILPTFTIISCAAAIIRAGAIPVPVDSDPYTWNMDVNKIREHISTRTRAIMVVHIYGLPTDMSPVLKLAEEYNLKIIEDAAEAHGLSYKGKMCGSFGDVSVFSFYPNKLITTGEGGMVLTDDPSLAEQLRSLRNLCFQPGKRFIHERLGWNFRMSNLQAALGVAQLERISRFAEMKKKNGRLYTRMLQDVEVIQLPLPSTDYAENIYWVFGIVLKDEVRFDALEAMNRLKIKGVGTRPFFWPIHEQPALIKMSLFGKRSCPIAERIARRGFYLPSGVGLTEDEIMKVTDALKTILNE